MKSPPTKTLKWIQIIPPSSLWSMFNACLLWFCMYAYTFEVYLNLILLHSTHKLKTMILFYALFRYKYRFEILLGILTFKKKDWYLFGILIFATLSQICYKPSISKILTFSLTILCQFIMWTTLTNHWYAPVGVLIEVGLFNNKTYLLFAYVYVSSCAK